MKAKKVMKAMAAMQAIKAVRATGRSMSNGGVCDVLVTASELKKSE